MFLHHALQYKSWADRRTIQAVAKIDAQAFPSAISFSRQQLNHMVRVEELFRARLLNLHPPHDSTNSKEVPLLAELEERLSASNAWLQQYAQEISTSERIELVRFQFVDGKRGSLTREEILFHLTNHGTYHRGAIGHALDLAGAPRPADTYTVFIHEQDAGRRINPAPENLL